MVDYGTVEAKTLPILSGSMGIRDSWSSGMEISEQERKEKARIFDLLVRHYGAGARVLNPRNHTNVYSTEGGAYDLKGIEEKFLDAKTGKLSAQALKHWTLLDKTLVVCPRNR